VNSSEQWIQLLAPLPVLLPMVAAACSLMLGRHATAQRTVTLITLTLVLVDAVVLMTISDYVGATAVQVGGWDVPIGITLVVDRLSAIMLVVSAVILLAVMTYAIGQGISDGDEDQPVSIFQPTFLILTAGVCNAFLAGDLFNLYVGFEVLLAASFVLLTLGASPERIRAGVSYVMVSIVSSLVFLMGIAFVYAATGTLNLADLAIKLQEVPSGTRTALYSVLMVAFGLKAAVFPLSAWLPDSYPTAPAPVTAVFAGLLTKVGIYSMLRAHTLLFPGGALDNILMVAGLLTMLAGILGAIAQDDIKRLLSFTLVSHIGYMVFGMALSTMAGLTGTIYYVGHHIIVQTTLFLVVGLIERQAGSSSLRRLGSLARTAPALSILFLVPALNLAGIPPFSGFIGKTALLQAGAQDGTWLAWVLVGGGAATSLLTLYVVARVWSNAFWRSRREAPDGELVAFAPTAGSFTAQPPAVDPCTDEELEKDLKAEGKPASLDLETHPLSRIPTMMLVPTVALVIVSVSLTVFAGPLIDVAQRAATNLQDRSAYVSAVMGRVITLDDAGADGVR
jgi:multicomponent Na+:H+ antiporter subunit D